MTKRISLLTFTALFFLSLPLWAQTSGSGGGHYVIEQRYVQQLLWIGDEYTLKYEVVVERNEGGGYRAYMREFTESPGLQVSLPPGNYRYRVISYDYLEQPGEASNWVIINIKPIPIVPVEVQSEDGGYVLHPYDDEQLIPGVNEIIIKNPDELEIKNGILAVEKQAAPESEKPVNVYISAAWEPLFPVYGRMQEIFDYKFYAAGAALRFGMLYNKLKWFNPGLELSTSWYAINSVQDNDKIGIQAGAAGFNITAQKPLPNPKMAVTVRAGGAIAFQISELSNDEYSYSVGGLTPQINLGASFLWLAWKQLFLEAGFDFSFIMNQNNNSGCLRPWLGAGWKF